VAKFEAVIGRYKDPTVRSFKKGGVDFVIRSEPAYQLIDTDPDAKALAASFKAEFVKVFAHAKEAAMKAGIRYKTEFTHEIRWGEPRNVYQEFP
jgi:hypothetical protein